MKKNLIIFFIFFTTILNSSEFCSLPAGSNIVIGCTIKCPKTYINALNKTAKELNYKVKLVTLNNKSKDYNSLLSKVDGIISPGGHDILPKYYSALLSDNEKEKLKILFKKYAKTNQKGKIRDSFEYNLFKYYFKDKKFKKLPILGICYGMQMIASVNNIPLYVDIYSNLGIQARRKVVDTVKFIKKSKFYKYADYFDTYKLEGYKNHHQAINLEYFNSMKEKKYYKNIIISAVSNNNKIAEIMEFKNRPVVGIQFHAERSPNTTRKLIYSYFLINACKYKTQKKTLSVKSLFKTLK